MLRTLLRLLPAFTLLAAREAATTDSWIPIVATNSVHTVLLRISVFGEAPGYGSGVLLSSQYVLTAKHLFPDEQSQGSQPHMIDGLIGWIPSNLDFSQARKLKVTYVSEKHDLAVLKSDTALVQEEAPAFFLRKEAIQHGQDLLVMGYPVGSGLDCVPGLASADAEDGKYATEASVGVSESGAPVFSSRGGFLGLLLEGSGRDQQGTARRGYLLRSSVIDEELTEQGLPHLTGADVQPTLSYANPRNIQFSYGIDDEKTDHQTLDSSERTFKRSFDAQPGYEITSATFSARSVNHLSKGPTIAIVNKGTRVVVTYTLQSGPLFDQWRGWIVGNIVTEQKPSIINWLAAKPPTAGKPA